MATSRAGGGLLSARLSGRTDDGGDTIPDKDGRSWAYERDGDEVTLTVPVTHRAAFRSRLYELGVRVRLVGPSANADELMTALRAASGESD